MLELLKILVVLVVLLSAGSFLLPAEYHVERSVVMDARPADVHPQVADLRAWKAWSWWEQQREGIETSHRHVALRLDGMLGEAFEQNPAAIKEIVEA